MARKTSEETEKTRARIFDAAAEVFARDGFKGASLSTIAERAAVPKSLVNHHFGSKQELWDSVRVRSFTTYVGEQLATFSAADSGAQFVRRSCTAYFRFLQENPGYLRMLFWNQADRSASTDGQHDLETSRLARQLIAGGAERLRELQQAGEIRPDLEPSMIVACFLGLLQQWFIFREDYLTEDQRRSAEDDEYLHTAVTLFWEGIRPEAAGVMRRARERS